MFLPEHTYPERANMKATFIFILPFLNLTSLLAIVEREQKEPKLQNAFNGRSPFKIFHSQKRIPLLLSPLFHVFLFPSRAQREGLIFLVRLK